MQRAVTQLLYNDDYKAHVLESGLNLQEMQAYTLCVEDDQGRLGKATAAGKQALSYYNHKDPKQHLFLSPKMKLYAETSALGSKLALAPVHAGCVWPSHNVAKAFACCLHCAVLFVHMAISERHAAYALIFVSGRPWSRVSNS